MLALFNLVSQKIKDMNEGKDLTERREDYGDGKEVRKWRRNGRIHY